MLTNLLQNVFVRLALYIVSLAVGIIPAAALSWVRISFDGTDWLTLEVSVQGLAAMVATAIGMSGGIFAKFGKR